MLVEVVKSQTSMRQEYFLSHNNLTLERVRNGRYRVLCTKYSFDGTPFDELIGYTFAECGYHIFVPYPQHKSPTKWFFGLTRCDAISGYLDSLNSSDPEA